MAAAAYDNPRSVGSIAVMFPVAPEHPARANKVPMPNPTFNADGAPAGVFTFSDLSMLFLRFGCSERTAG